MYSSSVVITIITIVVIIILSSNPYMILVGNTINRTNNPGVHKLQIILECTRFK